MNEGIGDFPHISLRLVEEGKAAAPKGGGSRVSERTSTNQREAARHGSNLKSSVECITSEWNSEKIRRQNEGKPALPEAISFILEVDPDSFDADSLKSFGIEVVADLERGYIIGASAETGLSGLRTKIDQFINSQRGGGKIPEIWDVLEGTRRPDYILSDSLKSEWSAIQEGQEYLVDVGISCIDIRESYSRCPKRRRNEADGNFQRRVARWLDGHSLSFEDWDDLYSARTNQLQEFVARYDGEILRNVMGDEIGIARLPDSFSCRVRILGRGLKDLVLNFPYVFDVSEPDEFCSLAAVPNSSESIRDQFTLEPPELDAPKVCVIDSGIQEQHPYLRAAIDPRDSMSWVPNELSLTADYVQGGGHGTRVSGAILFPQGISALSQQKALCLIQNARVLNKNNQLPKEVYPPEVLEEIVNHYHVSKNTRIFNHSISGIAPCRIQSMSPWASAIDKLSWEKDVLFIVAAGNIEANLSFVTRLSIKAHIQAGRPYPEYLLSPSARVADPAQSLQALTVGSVAHSTYNRPPLVSVASVDHPSSFSCSGPGIWDTIKPEVVEYGGDYVVDSPSSPSFTIPDLVCPELVRSTLSGGMPVSSDAVGTSFAAPKVTHIAAALAAAFPQESTLLYRALIVQSARLPNWTNESIENLYRGIRTMGYGIPSIDRALGNSPNRITLTTKGNEFISARQAKVYQVQIPESLLRSDFDFLIEITLSYAVEPRRTRRHRRHYLSTWLDWTCSKRGEDHDIFLARILSEYDSPTGDAEEGEGLFRWALGKKRFRPNGDAQRRPYGIDGIIKEYSRSSGTIQKDWAVVSSYDLREGFCVGVVGHLGWRKDLESVVPFSLVVSFEAIGSELPIYNEFVHVQQRIEVQQEVQLSSG
jgi:hypothetical protein